MDFVAIHNSLVCDFIPYKWKLHIQYWKMWQLLTEKARIELPFGCVAFIRE